MRELKIDSLLAATDGWLQYRREQRCHWQSWHRSQYLFFWRQWLTPQPWPQRLHRLGQRSHADWLALCHDNFDSRLALCLHYHDSLPAPEAKSIWYQAGQRCLASYRRRCTQGLLDYARQRGASLLG